MSKDNIGLRGQVKVFLNGELVDKKEFNQIHSGFREYIAACMDAQGNNFLDPATGLFDTETYETANTANYLYNSLVSEAGITGQSGIVMSTASDPVAGVQVYPAHTVPIAPDVAPADIPRSRAWSGSLYWLGVNSVTLTDAAIGFGLLPTIDLPIMAPADVFTTCYAFKTLSSPRELFQYDRLTIEWIITVV